ncbi:hypothetical protein [uncultured Ramlibacter sp.]|uniref:hypothetical protein n=1 Tax=uncultured Ramlibacter sp. TaxID=260755 RepID=UPI002630A7DB|nr:hypothetical protein [uncultured Ramlibacter sp.]
MASGATEAPGRAPAWATRWEQLFIVIACGLALAAIAVSLGHIGLSWDALNHHIYLGWTADQPRFDRDYLAASYQSYQFPYLYWPVYKLASLGASGVVAGVVLMHLHLTVVPALWILARACIPGHTWFDLGMRAIAVALAMANGIVLSMFDTTGNDLLAAIPLVWAIALAIAPLASESRQDAGWLKVVALSGFLAGVSTACKLSNAPIAVLLPIVWMWPAGSVRARLWAMVLGGGVAITGFAIVYGYWGWMLWTHYGNPFYPFFDPWMEPLRQWSGWVR